MEVVVLAVETEMQVESSLLGSGTDAAGKKEGGGGDVLYTYPLMKRRFHAPRLLTHALTLFS